MFPLFKELATQFNELFTFFVVFPVLLMLGLYLTIKLKYVQFSKMGQALGHLVKGSKSEVGTISHYEAVSAVLAGNFGTGNISGMAVAIATGGPGALVWMWVMAFFGSIIQYASCVLGVRYRQQNADGQYVGGPMYYLSKGLGFKKLGALFAIFAIIGAFTVGNLVQVNSIMLPLQSLSIDPLIFSILLAISVGVVILGGMQRFAVVASSIVPVMAVFYLGGALIILAKYSTQIIPAFELMFSAALNPGSLVGGAIGLGIMKTISTGFSRGVFATDAGTGLAPMIQSSAKTTSPVVDGMVALIAPFMVMVVCTITGLVLIVTDAWNVTGLQSTNLCTFAFEKGLGSKMGFYVVMISLLLFAYTTVLAWASCAERAVEYLLGKRYIRWFQYLYIAVVPVGAFAHVDAVWLIADVVVSLMMTANLIGVAGLSREVIAESRAYFLGQKEAPKQTDDEDLDIDQDTDAAPATA